MKKIKSPLKQTPHQQAQANNPYYNYLQLGGWDEAQAGIAEQRAAQRKAEQEQLQMQLQQIQLAELKTKQQEGLIVPADTGYNNVDLAIQGASRQLVDQAGSLTAQLKNGEIDTDQYAQKLAIIRSQVPAIGTFKETLSNNMKTYVDALQNGQLSHAMNAEAMDFYGSLMGDNGELQLGATEDGNVALVGLTKGGEQVSIPVAGSGQMPKPILKQPSPYELLKDPIKQLNKEAEFWGPDAADFAAAQLDNVLSQGGSAALKSLAADHYGMSLEDIEALDKQSAEGYSSELEKRVEERWIKDAETLFVDDQINAEQRRQFQIQQQKINTAAQQGGAGGLTANKAWEIAQEEARVQQDTQLLNTAIKNNSYGSLIGKGNIQNVEVSEPGLFATIRDKAAPGTVKLTLKGLDEPLEFKTNDPQLQQILATQLNLGTLQQANPTEGMTALEKIEYYKNQGKSPTKRSPFKQTDNGKKKVNAAEWLRKGQQYGRFKIGDENAKKYAWTNQGDDFIDPNTGERHRYDYLTEEGADEKSLGIGQRVRDAQAKADAAAAADYEAFIKERDEGYAGLGETVQANRARNIANSLAQNKGLPKTEDIQAFIEGHRGRETGKAATPEELAALTDYLERHNLNKELQSLYKSN